MKNLALWGQNVWHLPEGGPAAVLRLPARDCATHDHLGNSIARRVPSLQFCDDERPTSQGANDKAGPGRALRLLHR